MLDFSRIERINAEFKYVQENSTTPKRDVTTQLTPEQRYAWTSILSSAASAEGEEEHMVRPLIEFFSSTPEVQEYMHLHALDELRHASQLKVYLQETFGFVKTNKTLSDRIIYDQIFARMGRLVLLRPLPFVATLLFYEIFAEDFYAQLREKAEACHLTELTEYLCAVGKDELRHRAGIKWLFSYWNNANLPVRKSDLFWMKTLIFIVRLDISSSWWAFWNRKLRKSLFALGIDPNHFSEQATVYSRLAHEEMARLSH